MPIKNPVAVFNMDSMPFEETFEDENIRLEPGQSKVMSRSNAIMWLGRNPGMDKNTGTFKVKNLEIKPVAGSDMTGVKEVEEATKNRHKCMSCGLELTSEAELDAHLATHGSLLVKEEEKIIPEGIKCPLCEKTVKSAMGLRAHMAIHMREENEAKKAAA